MTGFVATRRIFKCIFFVDFAVQCYQMCIVSKIRYIPNSKFIQNIMALPWHSIYLFCISVHQENTKKNLMIPS